MWKWKNIDYIMYTKVINVRKKWIKLLHAFVLGKEKLGKRKTKIKKCTPTL